MPRGGVLMIFNADRLPVWRWDGTSESRCPECGHDLIAKRGDIVIWHWAHRPATAGRTSCPHEETAWHLQMKAAYLSFCSWEIEVPVEVNGQVYRADAMNRNTGRIREFIHSLSPHYIKKHRALGAAGFDVAWIMDGCRFASRKARIIGDDAYQLLKPRAYRMAAELSALVHHGDSLWRQQTNTNRWRRCTGLASAEVLRRFTEAGLRDNRQILHRKECCAC